MRKLYKFHWDCGRNGILEGIFVADDKDVFKVIGKEVYFYEVLGKHSEISDELKEADFEILTEDQDFIEKAFSLKVVPSGINPFDYLR